MKTRLSVAVLAALSLSSSAIAQPAATTAKPKDALQTFAAKTSAKLVVTSPAFKEGGDIPFENSQTRGNTFPGLAWSKGPKGTQSYFAVMQDEGSIIRGAYVLHWTLYDVPASVTKLDPGITTPPGGARWGPNQRNTRAYMGPRPGPGTKHGYHIQVFALDTVIPQDSLMSYDELSGLVSGHVLASGELVGMGVHDPNDTPQRAPGAAGPPQAR